MNNYTPEIIKRKAKNVRHLLIDADMQIKDLVDALGVHRSRFANAINGYNSQPWAYQLLDQAEQFLYKKLG